MLQMKDGRVKIPPHSVDATSVFLQHYIWTIH